MRQSAFISTLWCTLAEFKGRQNRQPGAKTGPLLGYSGRAQNAQGYAQADLGRGSGMLTSAQVKAAAAHAWRLEQNQRKKNWD
jgi:hypothetical protein